MYIITLYLIIIGLLIWIAGRELAIAHMQRQIAKAERDRARFLQRIQGRDRLIADQQHDLREMSHMASSVEEWPSVIMMQGNGEKDSLA